MWGPDLQRGTGCYFVFVRGTSLFCHSRSLFASVSVVFEAHDLKGLLFRRHARYENLCFPFELLKKFLTLYLCHYVILFGRTGSKGQDVSGIVGTLRLRYSSFLSRGELVWTQMRHSPETFPRDQRSAKLPTLTAGVGVGHPSPLPDLTQSGIPLLNSLAGMYYSGGIFWD